MSFLITYPEEKIDNELKQKLATVSEALYYPLRRLQPCNLTQKDKELIINSSAIGITSQYALEIYIDNLFSLNKQVTILLLSNKMRKKLLGRVPDSTKILIAPSENQRGLSLLVNQLHLQSLTLLTGNIGHEILLPTPVKKIQVYKNVWSQSLENEIVKKLYLERIHRVLVTSPSSYLRLKHIEARIPKSFISPIYYTLGPSTYEIIKKDQRPVVKPIQENDVLRQMLLKIIQDERS